MARISATGRPEAEGASSPRRRRGGFTLIEVLLVVALLALGAFAVALTLPPPRPTLQQEADAMARSLRDLRDRAIVEGRPLAVAFKDGGLEVREWRGGAWRLVEAPKPGAEGETGVAVAADADVLIFDPTGVSEPAAVTLSRDGEVRVLSIDGLGGMEVRSDPLPAP